MDLIKRRFITKFEWDKWNLDHILKDDISADDIEEAYFEDDLKTVLFDHNHSTKLEGRLIVNAKVPSSDRLLKFVLILRRRHLKVVTAYECSHDKKLIDLYNRKAA